MLLRKFRSIVGYFFLKNSMKTGSTNEFYRAQECETMQDQKFMIVINMYTIMYTVYT